MSLKLPDRLLRLIEKQSRARGVSKSELIRDCVERGIEEHQLKKEITCYDLSKHVIGSVKSGVPDLATNPKYMDGFGK
jgi:metal-responsive CopG/Arc/MetJ family transcriptional regulator